MNRQISFNKPLTENKDHDLAYMQREFKPMILVLKLSGLLPLTNHPEAAVESASGGSMSSAKFTQLFQHKWTSLINIYSISLFLLYLGLCIIFLPYFFYIAVERNRTTGDKMAVMLDTCFFAVQGSACVVAYILSQVKASSVAEAFNKLSAHVIYFVTYNPQFGRRSFRRTNILLAFWLILLLMVVIFLLILKSAEMTEYFKFSKYSKLIMMPLLFVILAQSTMHFMPGYVYCRVCELLGDCFQELGTMAKSKPSGKVNNNTKMTVGPSDQSDVAGDAWLDLYARFQDMTALCEELNITYGLYLISQLIALILTSVVHMYFVAFPHSGYHPGYLYAMPLSVCLGEVGWTVTAGNYGSSYKDKVESCSESLIQAASCNSDCAQDSRLFGPLMRLTSPVKGLHFSNFVSLDRGLPTLVLGILATYFVILIQFNGALENKLKS